MANYDLVVKCANLGDREELRRDLAAAGYEAVSRPAVAAAERKARARERSEESSRRRPSSEGQRLLLEVPGTTRVLAARLNVSAMTISSWRRGATTPEDDDRGRIEKVLGIDRRAWAVLPGDPAGHLGET